ncbi:MAG TPA: transglutaminase family protein [Stellaceae bacterium]|jgi:transglutaminase-like putative cysteine protease|nr:transglutaminase family protein [Stellaceae bacterium]
MQRRNFFKSVAAAGAVAGVMPGWLRQAHAAAAGWRQFEITYRIALKDGKVPARLWVPVPQDALDYQRVVNLSWRSPVAAFVLWEKASRAPIVSAAWLEPSAPRDIEVTARVATRDRSGFCLEDAAPDELAEYLRPTASSPTDGIVLAKAREIVGARTAPLDKARAIYDWVVDNTFRKAETRGCGLGNIAFMLETGDLGGKCADINSLFVGLARAAGLPARDFFGVRVADSKIMKSLGKSGDITKAQHCRAEVFIDGKGWLPVDPADVRKVVLEEQVAVDSDKVKGLRERLFGSWEMNWVGFNYARDFTLPEQKTGPIGFLMYPYAETADGSEDSLDPAAFAYTISAKEIV